MCTVSCHWPGPGGDQCGGEGGEKERRGGKMAAVRGGGGGGIKMILGAGPKRAAGQESCSHSRQPCVSPHKPPSKQCVLPTLMSNGPSCSPRKAPLRSGGRWPLWLRRWHGAPKAAAARHGFPLAEIRSCLPSLPAPHMERVDYGCPGCVFLSGLCVCVRCRSASARSSPPSRRPWRRTGAERLLRSPAAEPRRRAAENISLTSAFNSCKG